VDGRGRRADAKIQEWMGHRDLATTQIYADYAPSSREAEMVAAAFERRCQPPARSREDVREKL
jgi:integrase